jgi:hypothetical protein
MEEIPASTFRVKQVRGPSDELVHISQATRHHIPEDRNAWLARREEPQATDQR